MLCPKYAFLIESYCTPEMRTPLYTGHFNYVPKESTIESICRQTDRQTHLPHEAVQNQHAPRRKEVADLAVQPGGPVDDDYVHRGQDEHDGQLTDRLGQVVGREVVGATGSLLGDHYPLRGNWSSKRKHSDYTVDPRLWPPPQLLSLVV